MWQAGRNNASSTVAQPDHLKRIFPKALFRFLIVSLLDPTRTKCLAIIGTAIGFLNIPFRLT